MGPLDEIYTTLIVRIHYTNDFEMERLWHYAADFVTHDGRRAGLIVRKEADDRAEIQIYFEAGLPTDTQVSFIKYVHEHLRHFGDRKRIFYGAEPFTALNLERVRKRLFADKS